MSWHEADWALAFFSFSMEGRIDNATLVTSVNLRLLPRDSWYGLLLKGMMSCDHLVKIIKMTAVSCTTKSVQWTQTNKTHTHTHDRVNTRSCCIACRLFVRMG